MVSVAHKHESTGDDVVGEHLPVVLPALFDIDDEYLLEPEGELYEVVPFEQPVHLSVRPARPKLMEIEPVLGVIH